MSMRALTLAACFTVAFSFNTDQSKGKHLGLENDVAIAPHYLFSEPLKEIGEILVHPVDVLRAELCFKRAPLISHETCMVWLTKKCNGNYAGTDMCDKFKKYLDELCGEGEKKACEEAKEWAKKEPHVEAMKDGDKDKEESVVEPEKEKDQTLEGDTDTSGSAGHHHDADAAGTAGGDGKHHDADAAGTDGGDGKSGTHGSTDGGVAAGDSHDKSAHDSADSSHAGGGKGGSNGGHADGHTGAGNGGGNGGGSGGDGATGVHTSDDASHGDSGHGHGADESHGHHDHHHHGSEENTASHLGASVLSVAVVIMLTAYAQA